MARLAECPHEQQAVALYIGIDLSGWSGLSPAARAVITDADLIVGGARHLDMVPASAARRLQWKSPLSETIIAH